MRQFVTGFLFCALVASIAMNVIQYNGALINKANLQIVVSAELQEAVKRYNEDQALENAIMQGK